jgi:hypothetical protein
VRSVERGRGRLRYSALLRIECASIVSWVGNLKEGVCKVTKKDYVRLSAILQTAHKACKKGEPPWIIVEDIQRQIGDWLQSDNPNFDPDSWTEACKP